MSQKKPLKSGRSNSLEQHTRSVVRPRTALAAMIALTALCFIATPSPRSRAADTAPPQAAPAPAPKPAAPPTTPKPAGAVTPEEMAGIDFTGLTPEQKTFAVSILNENSCDCSCGMKIAVCRRDDPNCGRSMPLGNQVVGLVKQGKTREEIVKIALTPPSKFVQFAMNPGDAPALGPADAKVTLVHYYDYQCPFCSRLIPVIDQIAKDYPKDVRIVFKMHPLTIHPNAPIAAEAAMAAKAQGKFFEMNKALFGIQQTLTRDNIIAAAKANGLDVERFTKDIDTSAYAAAIAVEGAESESLGASGTPASFVNGRFVSGAKSYEFFKQMIDEELKWAQEGTRPKFAIGKNVSEASAAQTPSNSGPDLNKTYEIAAGGAPSQGPANAKVTILHYMDYQ